MAINMNTYSYTKENNLPEGVSENLEDKIINTLQDTPLTFIENRGQMDSKVKYYVKGNGYTFYFTQSEIKFSFIQKKSTKESKPLDSNSMKEKGISQEKEEFMTATIAQEFIDANKEVKIEPQDKCMQMVNYFKGNDPTKWQTQVPTYEKIIYKEIWKGIDLVFYGEKGKLKYDFIVKQEASVEDIKFIYKGFDEKFIDEKGNLIIKTPLGELIDEKPICYQQVKGEKVIIESDFIVREAENQIFYGYKIQGDYDKNYPIIIDPGIIYSSYLGGTGSDACYGMSITVDQNGNTYVTGYTASYNFPVVNAFQPSRAGYFDVFVTKIDSTPSIVYSSYLGGSALDVGLGIAVDQNGSIYVTGYTESTDFPTINAFQPSKGGYKDAFVTKIDSTPSIVYSSYLGGSGVDFGRGIAVDQNGNAYVTGETFSTDFPTVNAFQASFAGASDAFVTKINSTPLIVYSSFLGGSFNDSGYGIAVDQNENVYVTGETNSTNFPTINAFQPSITGTSDDAFITKIDSTPSIVYSSYLGGSKEDKGYGITVDQNGNVYVTGYTESTDFPIANAFQPSLGGTKDAFVTKIDPTPSIVYSSYLGGSSDDFGHGIAVDCNGNAYVTGYTESTDFLTANAFQPSSGGAKDAFVTKIDSTPSIAYSSYLGGNSDDFGHGIAVDHNGNAYVTGYTESTDFPTVNAFQASKGGYRDVFVTKIGGPLFLTINCANLSAVVFN